MFTSYSFKSYFSYVSAYIFAVFNMSFIVKTGIL